MQYNHPKIDISGSRSHWDIFPHNRELSLVIKLHFEIFEGNTREISTWKYPQGFHRERRRKYPHRKFPFISPEFPQGNYEEISAGMIPWNSPINPCENLGDVDGLPAGMDTVDFSVDWPFAISSLDKAFLAIVLSRALTYWVSYLSACYFYG